MTQINAAPKIAKINRKFVTRLTRLARGERVRAIVLLQTYDAGIAFRASRDREAAVQAVRRQAEAAFPDIDRVLDEFGGERLSSGADALGGVAVETTAEGIFGLTSLNQVKAVLEDQPLTRIP